MIVRNAIGFEMRAKMRARKVKGKGSAPWAM
jgi:hypothetical protein